MGKGGLGPSTIRGFLKRSEISQTMKFMSMTSEVYPVGPGDRTGADFIGATIPLPSPLTSDFWLLISVLPSSNLRPPCPAKFVYASEVYPACPIGPENRIGVKLFFSISRGGCWTFDLPAMPLGGLGRMSSCLGPVTMIIPPSFVMHGRRVFNLHRSFLPFHLLSSFL